MDINFSGIRFCLMRLRYPSYMDPVARISVAGRQYDTLWTTFTVLNHSIAFVLTVINPLS